MEKISRIARGIVKATIRPQLRRFGFDIVRCPHDISEENMEIDAIVRPYTKTSRERVNALIEAVRYLVANQINGAMVECGVWKGGSIMAIALTLKRLNAENRELYLYDTFSGMPTPGDVDVTVQGKRAGDKFAKTQTADDASKWCLSEMDEVKQNVFTTGYPEENIYFIKGKVEETIPHTVPKEIALLRLDTDWYASTKHEMTHLFPRLNRHGVLIIDDYGHWEGVRKAVDEYISDHKIRILLNRIDSAGRIAIKSG